MQCCGKTWLGAASCRFGEWCVFRSAEHRPTKASAPCVRGKSSPANIITYLSTCISRLPAAKKYAKCAAWSTINSLSTVITRNKTGRRNAMMGVYLLMDELLDMKQIDLVNLVSLCHWPVSKKLPRVRSLRTEFLCIGCWRYHFNMIPLLDT